MNKQQLANKIWESANKMRSKIEANEYKDYILGFIFYKYLSDKEIKFLKENDFSEEDIAALKEEDFETVEYIQKNVGYFISYNDLFSTWIKKGKDFDVSNVRDALSAFGRLIYSSHKKVFDGVFDTLQTGLSKLGDSSGAQTKAISSLIQLIKDIPMDGKQDYDVLGFIYEYLISMFAANAGKKAGEFYTPHEVSVLMSEIVAGHLNGRSEIKIYDPTSGSGSLLINIGQSVSKYISDEDNIKYYAQELKENTYNLTRMNLVMRGIKPDNIVTRNGDTLEDDWPYFNENDPVNTYNPLYVDAVVSNPPYSQVWDPANKETDPRYARFGLAPKGKADYAFLLHDLFHIKPDGIMTIVLPHGVLFRGGEEGEIRKNLIENNHIDTIIGLPANIFFGTGIPTIVMVLKQKCEDTDILIVDASKGFIKEGKNNKLRASDIKKIADVVTGRKESFKFSRVVSREEIRENDYNLNIPRYVDSSEEAESWDIYASMFGGIPQSEINTLSDYWTAFPNLKKDLFIESDIPYVQLKNINVKEMLQQHPDIIEFEEAFKNKFGDFSSYLKEHLILQMADIQISKEESVIANDIFSRMKEIPLINKYEAYQLLDDDWVKISIDLEIIRTEGFEATKKVDPNIIIKKKDGKDHEVQEGWIGHVIPFELIQETLLKEEADELKRIETRLAEIPNQYEEILDSLSEDEKESDICNETGDAFVVKEVIKKIKDLKGVTTQESVVLYDKLVKVAALLDSEREYKSEIKKKSAELQNHTKEVIENLSDDEVYLLLEKKWIEKLIENLFKLPDTNVDNLTNKIISISEKYRNTYSEIENQIQETEKELCDMIELLTGNEYDMKGLGEFKSLLLGE
ncbi:MAG: type I restriction-modification system subunit M [Lachnospiraceae bacterium]|nr:type I restriction-modification system subunit M [Lachnospiraceae bacterium]